MNNAKEPVKLTAAMARAMPSSPALSSSKSTLAVKPARKVETAVFDLDLCSELFFSVIYDWIRELDFSLAPQNMLE